MKKEGEVFISVDLETSGSVPGRYSILSIGACAVDDPEQTFYRELKPISKHFERVAMRVNGLSSKKLRAEGLEPREALCQMKKWLRKVAQDGKPVFVGFNAPFDWMFSHWYFVNFFGSDGDPFGYSALDIKAYYMGMSGEEKWRNTGKGKMPREFIPEREFSHNALDDALYQAEMFRRMRKYRSRSK